MNLEYRWFVLILVMGTLATLALAGWKMVGRQRRNLSGSQEEGYNGEIEPTFIGRLSWRAVPWPVFLAIAYLAAPYIRLVILWGKIGLIRLIGPILFCGCASTTASSQKQGSADTTRKWDRELGWNFGIAESGNRKPERKTSR